MASAPVQDLNGTVRTLKTPYIQVIPENELAVVPVSSPPPVVVNDGVQTTRVLVFLINVFSRKFS